MRRYRQLDQIRSGLQRSGFRLWFSEYERRKDGRRLIFDGIREFHATATVGEGLRLAFAEYGEKPPGRFVSRIRCIATEQILVGYRFDLKWLTATSERD